MLLVDFALPIDLLLDAHYCSFQPNYLLGSLSDTPVSLIYLLLLPEDLNDLWLGHCLDPLSMLSNIYQFLLEVGQTALRPHNK
jgi:hypothetical protein